MAVSGRESDASVELGLRFSAVQVGYWLGWASIAVVLTGLALDSGARHRSLLVALTLVAAAGNSAAMVIPWRTWLTTRRGRLLLDLWCGALIAFVALLVVNAGSNFALLLFLAVPFIAVVQIGWRRGSWLAVSALTCAVAASFGPLSADATVMRLILVAAVVAVALVLTRAIRRAAVRAQHERTLAQESNHRIKNDLQTVADLLLLGRPENENGVAFDETAARIRSIATVHRLLTEATDTIDGAALIAGVTESAPVHVEIDAEHATFDAQTAQKLGIVTNELVTNAVRHGEAPIVVHLSGGASTRLCVDSGGRDGVGPARAGGFGLVLVRRLVDGLDGSFELHTRADGGTRAEVTFPTVAR
jgi:two-component sensor histidine kinase